MMNVCVLVFVYLLLLYLGLVCRYIQLVIWPFKHVARRTKYVYAPVLLLPYKPTSHFKLPCCPRFPCLLHFIQTTTSVVCQQLGCRRSNGQSGQRRQARHLAHKQRNKTQKGKTADGATVKAANAEKHVTSRIQMEQSTKGKRRPAERRPERSTVTITTPRA